MQNISLWITPPGLVKHGITIEIDTKIGITIELDTKINSFLKVQSEVKHYPDDGHHPGSYPMEVNKYSKPRFDHDVSSQPTCLK